MNGGSLCKIIDWHKFLSSRRKSGTGAQNCQDEHNLSYWFKPKKKKCGGNVDGEWMLRSRNQHRQTPTIHYPLHPPAQAWMHPKINSDPLPQADTSLFDPGFLSGFGPSSSNAPLPAPFCTGYEVYSLEYTMGESPWPGSGRMADVRKGECAGITAYSGSPKPLKPHPPQQQVLAPVPVMPTAVMFDDMWSYRHPQQQVENDMYGGTTGGNMVAKKRVAL
ncbi:hypothetical protein BDQ17DRAFT_1411448 [Cyathus striatus]|nr:hypothetical protein BDQ17DRAFT_1411448 [Cyathus striatus]